MLYCLTCNKELIGKQTKFCSLVCKNSNSNGKHQMYFMQQKRGMERKKILMSMKGGKCCKCGYNKNQSALSFHHIDPTKKEIRLDIRRCSNSTWEKLVEEVDKCILVCMNCHAEIHNPHLNNLP